MSVKADEWLRLELRVCADCPFAEEGGDDIDDDAEPVFYCRHPKCETKEEPLDVFAIPPQCPIRSEPVVLCVEK